MLLGTRKQLLQTRCCCCCSCCCCSWLWVLAGSGRVPKGTGSCCQIRLRGWVGLA